MYTVNVSIEIVEEPGSDWKDPTEQPRLVLTFIKNIESAGSKLEILWVKTALCLPQSSQWIPGSMQQNVWDNLHSSHATGFQMDIRMRRTCGEVLGFLLQASLLPVGVKMCFKFGGVKALRKSPWETREQPRSDIHKAHAVSILGSCRFCATDTFQFLRCPSACLPFSASQEGTIAWKTLTAAFLWWILLCTAVCGSGLPLSVSPAGSKAGEVESLPQPLAALGVAQLCLECTDRALVVSSEGNCDLLCLFWGFSRRLKY